MRLIKYLALALTLVAGQSMASPYYGHGHGYGHGHYGHHASYWKIRKDAQYLINAERYLLSSVKYYGSAYSHAANDVRALIRRTIALKNSAYSGYSRYTLKRKMRAIRIKFRHVRYVIARSHRLHHSSQIAMRLRNVAFKMRRLTRDVYGYRGRHYSRW